MIDNAPVRDENAESEHPEATSGANRGGDDNDHGVDNGAERAAVAAVVDERLRRLGAVGTDEGTTRTGGADDDGAIGGDGEVPLVGRELVTEELRKRDAEAATAVRETAQRQWMNETATIEAERRRRRKAKRLERQSVRRQRRSDVPETAMTAPEEKAETPVTSAEALDDALPDAPVTAGDEQNASANRAQSAECDVATKWSVHVKDVLEVAEERRVEQAGELAKEKHATAKTTVVRVSRTRRRYEKRVVKARAKAKRALREWLEANECPEEAYYKFDEMWRRGTKDGVVLLSREVADTMDHERPRITEVSTKPIGRRGHSKRYEYSSGSVYQGPSARVLGDDRRRVRVGRLRAVQAPAVDSLPTARVKTGNGWKSIKLDTGAQYSVAGAGWQADGVHRDVLPPVDYVEGFTGAVARVLGVRRFRFQTQYDQEMEVDALVVEGAAGEFLLGEDWMLQNGVKIDFTACEMKWYDGDHKKILPFSCTQGGQKEIGGAAR
ncbi:hypothetical protein PHMEG_00029230, partial [Phytophthora megakarya]